MARFLSDAWFEEAAADAPPTAGRPLLVLQQIVTGSPDGEVRYHVHVGEGSARLHPGQAERPDATFTQGYDTAVAVARGELTTEAALLAGRIVVAGDMANLSARRRTLAGLDPLPPAARTATTF